jgi:hypothetical protein
LKVGDKVEARFQGRSKWFKATIIQSHAYGTFDVEYEDGDRETNVAAELIRPVEGARRDERSRDQARREGASLEIGDKVEAQFKGGKKFFPCKITAVNRDGSYDVRYDDGDRESDLPAERVRKPEARQGRSTGAKEPQVSPSDRSVLVELRAGSRRHPKMETTG